VEIIVLLKISLGMGLLFFYKILAVVFIIPYGITSQFILENARAHALFFYKWWSWGERTPDLCITKAIFYLCLVD